MKKAELWNIYPEFYQQSLFVCKNKINDTIRKNFNKF